METKIGMLSKILKDHKDEYLTGGEISKLIFNYFDVNLNTRMIHKLISELIEVGYYIEIKVIAHNTRVYCFKNINL